MMRSDSNVRAYSQFSVTRRYVDFLFDHAEGDWLLAPADESTVGEDV
jgi:hypothetical protein